MAESLELNKIKKAYGERFMKLCRELFPTILEHEGVLFNMLTSSFSNNSNTLYDDIHNANLEENLKNYIYSKIDIEDLEKPKIEEKTPYELLNEAGYDLFECTTEEEIQKFKKYYVKNEELCTFYGGRLNKCVVFFAVRKDVDNIKREDFENPAREDEYGTSVMGIQFTKSKTCTVSIKNRYNHTVNNPDATHGNNLDKITPGLTQSFAKLLLERGLELNSNNIEEFEIPGYTVAADGKYYKYNMEINWDYYCPGNIIIKNGEAIKLENPEKQILIDYFIIDIENKSIQLFDEEIKDSFVDDLKNIEKIDVLKDKESKDNTKIILIKKKGSNKQIKIKIDKNNQIIGYENNELTEVGNNFLAYNKVLETLELPNLRIVGNLFLSQNRHLKDLSLPNLEEVGKAFLSNNQILDKLELQNLRTVEHHFLYQNKYLRKLSLPNLEKAGSVFLFNNKILETLELQNLRTAGGYFLYQNEHIKELYLPNLEEVEDGFLYTNQVLKIAKLPNLRKVGDGFLRFNKALETLESQNLKIIGKNFLFQNIHLKELSLPNLEEVEEAFLPDNQSLEKINLPKLPKVEEELKLCINSKLQEQRTMASSITSKSITKLDKENNITESEINKEGNILKNLNRETEKNSNAK